ncbi:MAG: glycosyltransferase family 2 protein [Planctomycetaceae bacterium]|nr:glycosyltransferase family 2 protein [Planctomycetaceae bacterium]
MMVERVRRFQVPEARPRADCGPLLTVIIVNYNGWSDVLRLVEGLAATTEVATGVCEIVVVDNSSQGPIPVELALPRPGLRLIVRDDNGGFAVGVNAGWRAARSRWLLVLNPDVEVPEGALAQVVARVERYEADPDTAPGVIGFGLRNPDGSRQPSVGTFPSLSRTVREQLIPRSRRKYQPGWRIRPGSVAWVTGACMLVNSRLLDVLGGMDEDFFLYHEEVALCRSAHGLGWRVDYDPSVEVVHLRPLQNRAISPKMRVITRHSKLLYFRKYLSGWEFLGLSWIISVEAVVRGAWSRMWRRAEDVRAWQTIGEVARAFRAGREPRGRNVLRLADAPDGRRGISPTVRAGKPKPRRARAARPLEPRKDGP